VLEPRLRGELEALFDLYLEDACAWHMRSDGSFIQACGDGGGRRAQTTLMKRWRGGITTES
jgi:hypothetical protein